MSIITVSENCLNIPIKRPRFFTLNKKARHNDVLYEKPTFKYKNTHRTKLKECEKEIKSKQ